MNLVDVTNTVSNTLTSQATSVVNSTAGVISGAVGSVKSTVSGALNSLLGSVGVAVNPTSSVASDNSSLYQLHIVNNDFINVDGSTGLYISAFLPETFELSITNEFDTPFSQMAQNAVGGGAKGAALTLMGASVLTQAMTAQMWSGSRPVQLTFPLIFIAETDPVKDVTDPIAALTKLSMPRRMNTGSQIANNFLVPPGPKLNTSTLTVSDLAAAGTALASGDASGATSGLASKIQDAFTNMKDVTTIVVGNYLMFQSVVIESVSSTFDVMLDANGNPMKASVQISFSSYFTPIADDIDQMFLTGSGFGKSGGK